jgi:hypothetical protein
MQLGTARADPGTTAYGWFHVTGLPTGGDERLPVVLAEGEADGPTLWITAGIHGNEATGVAVAQDVMDERLPERLSGSVVCLPSLNPAGLRRNVRTSYYDDDDPNRFFPDPDHDATRPPKVQERIDRRLFEAFEDSADALVDLHTAQTGSMPFAIRDRVLYGEVRDREEAEALADDLDAIVEAFGLPVLTEYPAEEYLEQSLQRSTAGAALNAAGIPAFTAELGGHRVVEEDARAAGVAGLHAVMVELGMLDESAVPDDVADSGDGVPAAPVDYPVRRARHPHVDSGGLVRHRVDTGDVVAQGDVVADVVTPHGEVVDEVVADHDGYVISRREGLAVYEGDAVTSMAVRDEGDLVVSRQNDA